MTARLLAYSEDGVRVQSAVDAATGGTACGRAGAGPSRRPLCSITSVYYFLLMTFRGRPCGRFGCRRAVPLVVGLCGRPGPADRGPAGFSTNAVQGTPRTSR